MGFGRPFIGTTAPGPSSASNHVEEVEENDDGQRNTQEPQQRATHSKPPNLLARYKRRGIACVSVKFCKELSAAGNGLLPASSADWQRTPPAGITNGASFWTTGRISSAVEQRFCNALPPSPPRRALFLVVPSRWRF